MLSSLIVVTVTELSGVVSFNCSSLSTGLFTVSDHLIISQVIFGVPVTFSHCVGPTGALLSVVQ